MRQDGQTLRQRPTHGRLPGGREGGGLLGGLAKLEVQPFGLDLSSKMIDLARARLPDLAAVVENAANFGDQFPDESFDLIATHFITGFVPMAVVAPKIWGRLAPGGYWSFVGGTKAGFPALQRRANSRALNWLFGGKALPVDDLVCNPVDGAEVVRTLEANGFTIQQTESFAPGLHFADLDEFLEFGYWGGWLTPFIEDLGLHKAAPLVRVLLNLFVFPVDDQHAVEIVGFGIGVEKLSHLIAGQVGIVRQEGGESFRCRRIRLHTLSIADRRLPGTDTGGIDRHQRTDVAGAGLRAVGAEGG